MADTQDLIPAGWMLVRRESIEAALSSVRSVMEAVYQRRYPECCGRAHSECCGNFDEALAPADAATLDGLSPAESALASMLDALPAPAAREPLTFEEWWESDGPNTVSAYEAARSTWEFLVAHGVNQHKERGA